MTAPAAPRMGSHPPTAVDSPPGAAPIGAVPDVAFAAVLDITTARTATAEGQTPETPDQAADLPTADVAVAPTAGVDVDVAAALALSAPVPAAAPAGQTAAPAHDSPEPAAPALPVPVPVKPSASAPEPVPAPAPPAAPEAAAPATAEPAPAKAQPAPVQPDAPAQPAPAQPAPAQPAAPLHPAEPFARAAGGQAPRPVIRGERIEAIVKLTQRHGAAEARMELHPQELGSVVVKLRVTADGLAATFTASNPDAVGQLQQAGEDLRRTLESKGLTLASLDVRAQSEDARGRHGGERRHHGHNQRAAANDAGALEAETTSTTTILPAGALVDVQA
jgi:hypothetical protein